MSQKTHPTESQPTTARHASRFAPVELVRFAAVGVQLVLIVLVVRTYAVENSAFFRLLLLACGGFVLHHFLPSRWRMPFFAVLSLGALTAIVGVANAGQIIGLGIAFIAIAHLPIGFWLRVLLLIAAGAALAVVRVGSLTTPLSNAIWPIFGSMFMFRMIVYMYDMRTRAAPFGVWRALSYFFMLPNICFPLFPVVDYKSFCRNHYNDDDIRIYQTGAEWIFRGVVQLLLYRWVYQNLLTGAEAVDTPLDAAVFMVTTVLTYLKISGSFHIIIGMMHLFGFNLGRANNKYFLAESFTDYWRRVNIYWKDFLQKVFFNPIYFRLNRKMAAMAALIVTTLIAFFVTWALHSVQWFWIRGAFPVRWQDLVFWTVMGLLVLGNMIVETKVGRQRSLKKVRHSFGSELRLALRTVGTFVIICACWTAWSSESFGEFTMVIGRLIGADARSILVILGALAGLGIVAVIVARADRSKVGGGLAKGRKPIAIWKGAYHVAASCVVILVIAYAPLVVDVDPVIFSSLDNLKTPRLNLRDSQMLDRGYYEDLTSVASFNSALNELYAQKPPNWDRNWALHSVDGYPDFELVPNKRVAHKGAVATINRWGMRDRDYEQQAPFGTYRVVLFGASHAWGTGVEDDLVLDNVVEDRLNRERSAAGGDRVEIMNFSVPGFGPVERLADLDQRILSFDFDALVYVGVNDLYWVAKNLVDAARGDLPVPFAYLTDAIRDAGLTQSTAESEGMKLLEPRREELILWVYREIVRRCEERGIVPVAAFIPQPKNEPAETKAMAARQIVLAREAGFAVIDMLAAYDGVDDKSTLWIAPWDRHPNAAGHDLLANMLYDGLKRELKL